MDNSASSTSSFSRLPLCSHLLQQCLRSFCSDTHWIYAVFWRILPRNFPPPKWELGGYLDRTKANKRNWILVWEDGFCDFARATTTGNAAAFQPDIFFKMSHEVYNYGEGLVGKISSDDGHKWVFKDPSQSDQQTPSWQSSIDPQPRIWEAQFRSGIQTIAVISVCEGLVQLGSIEKIPEDLEFVALLQRKFNNMLLNLPGFSSTQRILGGTAELLSKTDNYDQESMYRSNLERQLSWNGDHLGPKQAAGHVQWSSAGSTVSSSSCLNIAAEAAAAAAWQAPPMANSKSIHIRRPNNNTIASQTRNILTTTNPDYQSRIMPPLNTSLDTLLSMLPSVASSTVASQLSSDHITDRNTCYIRDLPLVLEHNSPDLHRTVSAPITAAVAGDYWLQEAVNSSNTPPSPLLQTHDLPQHRLLHHISLGADASFRPSDSNPNSLGDCSYFGDSVS